MRHDATPEQQVVGKSVQDDERLCIQRTQGEVRVTPTQEAINKIEGLEREVAIRHEEVERRLERGDKRFDKLEMMIWGVYATVIIAVALPQLLVR